MWDETAPQLKTDQLSGLFPQDSCSFSLHIVMCYLVVKSFVLNKKNYVFHEAASKY